VADNARPRGQRRSRSGRRARVETSSGGVVFRRDSTDVRFLLIRDPYTNWGLPKGHIEGGETPEQAALREVEEETGLSELHIVAPLPTIDWYFRDRGKLVHKFCHFFLVESLGGEAVPQIDEGITECIWRPPSVAVETVSYSNAREVMRAAEQLLRTDPGTTAGASADASATEPSRSEPV
jgi:8-oxo-dGTP pyrophosphatase MutT (NUDIX family)